MADIDLKPTAEMAANATRGLELREKHGKGGTAVGVARARDIKNRANLSPDTVKRMHSFFSRHEGNQAGGEDDAGYIAWMLWGGDAGKSWAKRKVEQIDGKSESMKSDNNRPGAKAKFGQVGDMLRSASSKAANVFSKPGAQKEILRIIGKAFREAGVYRDDLKKINPHLHERIDNLERFPHLYSVTEAMAIASQIRKSQHGRPGAKASFAIPPDSYIRKSDYIKQLLNEIARAFKQKNHEDLKEASHDLLNFAKQLREEAWRDAADMKNNPQDWSRPGAKAKFQKLSEHMNHIVALCDKVLAVLYRESPDKSLGGVWAKTAQDVHEIKATAHQISRQSWAYSRPDSAAKFSSNPYIAAAVKKAGHLRLAAKDLIAALSSGNKDEALRIVSGMRYSVENIDTHIKAFMSRPGSKAKAARNQADVDPRSEETYEWVHRRRPKGRGSWAFIAPNESLVFVPGQMTYSEAKKWLKENAPMSGRYKVATQRPGSAAKFGQVGEMLSQIESQSHDQRDLAKSNLRKLAAKIADIDHTREEWERYVRVAKSLGYSESQIAGFSRHGAKSKFEKSDEYAAILMKPVTVANCGRMMKVAEEAMKYAKSVGDDDLFELAEEVGHECQATKSRASRKEAR